MRLGRLQGSRRFGNCIRDGLGDYLSVKCDGEIIKSADELSIYRAGEYVIFT